MMQCAVLIHDSWLEMPCVLRTMHVRGISVSLQDTLRGEVFDLVAVECSSQVCQRVEQRIKDQLPRLTVPHADLNSGSSSVVLCSTLFLTSRGTQGHSDTDVAKASAGGSGPADGSDTAGGTDSAGGSDPAGRSRLAGAPGAGQSGQSTDTPYNIVDWNNALDSSSSDKPDQDLGIAEAAHRSQRQSS